MVEWVGLSNRSVQNEYYFHNGKLIFVYAGETYDQYNDSLQTLDRSKVDVVLTRRYYFKNDKLIGFSANSKDCMQQWQKEARVYLKNSGEYNRLLKAKK